MRGLGRSLRTQPGLAAAVFVVPMALVVAVASLSLLTVVSCTRSGPS